MSSFDTAREKWEEYHMNQIKSVKEAALKGDPEAMETMAYHIAIIMYNCDDQVISLLTKASDAGRQSASWKLADYYAHLDGFDGTKYRDLIEHYCLLAFSTGKIYSYKEPECIYGTIKYWMEEYHPEWCEKEKGLYTYRYGKDVFTQTGAREKLDKGTKLIITDYLLDGENKKMVNSTIVPLTVGIINNINTKMKWKIDEVSDTVVRITVYHPDRSYLKKFTLEKCKKVNYSTKLVDVEHEFKLELIS